jgi:hypothetical protein
MSGNKLNYKTKAGIQCIENLIIKGIVVVFSAYMDNLDAIQL